MASFRIYIYLASCAALRPVGQFVLASVVRDTIRLQGLAGPQGRMVKEAYRPAVSKNAARSYIQVLV